MARLISTMPRIEEKDVKALKRARAAGHFELIRRSLRLVVSRFYGGRRPPTTRLFESIDNKVGDESELFKGSPSPPPQAPPSSHQRRNSP